MPDIYGNPTEAERRGQAYQPTTPYSYTPNILAGIKARNTSGISTQDIYGANGLISHNERATPTRDTRAGAPAFQGAFMDDPFFQRSDVAPALLATNRDTAGGGAFGVRNWLHDHPAGTIAAMIAAAAGGAAASGAFASGAGASAGGGAAASGGVGGGLTGTGIGAGEGAAAAGGAGGAAGAGTAATGAGWTGGFSGASSFAPGLSAGGGAAGSLAASGGIAGGAGVGGTTAGALGGLSGVANQVSGAGDMGGKTGGLWGNLLTLGGSLYNTYQQQQGAKDASRAQQQGDAAGLAELRRQYDQSRADQAPWLQAGTAALGRLQDPNAFTQSPGYAFVRNEALNGVQNGAAAQGGLYSGNAARALQDRAAGLASTDYGNWFNQQSSLAGLGQSATQSLGALGQNSANGVSNLLGQQANARASGIVDQTNATTNGLNDVGQWYGNWLRQRQLGGG